MGNKWGSEIVAALQKHGPCSPAKLAEYVGVDRPAISHALAPMIKAKEVKVSGATISRMIALPGQDLPDAKPTAKKNVAAKKVHPQVAKVHSNTATSALTPPQSDLGIAINDQGELGLQRGDLRLALDASDVARLQRFLDCTKQFWAGA